MDIQSLSSTRARPLTRPSCVGMRALDIAQTEHARATALYFTENAHSDEHAAPYDQWLVVTRGNGWVSVGNARTRVTANDVVTLPQKIFHQFWTENETLDALAFALQITRGPELVRVPHRVALAGNAAQRFVTIAQDAIKARGKFFVALSGGSTPRDLYDVLATAESSHAFDWSRAHLFWGDERAVPPDHQESNYRLARDTLITRVPIPLENVHRILGENKPDAAARAYEKTLRDVFGLSALPRFDLILLGLGENGHTASLFPNSRVLREKSRWVAADFVKELDAYRLTLTPLVINAAENILFLVAGVGKAPAVRATLRGDARPSDFPAQLIQPPNGNVVWLLEKDAASLLEDWTSHANR